MPKISVIMPTYNTEKYLKEAVDSILSQTFADFELIVIDDGSTDKTIDILNSFNDKRIRILQGDKKGIAAALNKGIKNSNSEYIARMDADDIAMPKRFEKQIKFLDSNLDYGICGTFITAFSEKGEEQWFENLKEHVCWFDLLKDVTFCHPTVMIRKKVLEQNDLMYDETFLYGEDGDFWLRLLKKTKGYNIPEKLLRYRVHKNKSLNWQSYEYGNLNKLNVLCEFIPNKPVLSILDSAALYDDIIKSIEKYCDLIKEGNKSTFINDQEIPIFISVADDIIDIVSVAMISILENTKSHIHFYFLENNLMLVSDDKKSKINELKKRYFNFDITYFEIDAKKFESFKLSTQKYIKIDTYFRYLIPNLVPDIDKCIYLDYDVIVNGDISNLFNINLKNNIIGAVCNDASPKNQKILKDCIKKCGIKDGKKYFNAGVILWDLKKSRESNIVDTLFSETESKVANLDMADQDILNIVFEDKFLSLDKTYNMYPYNIQDDSIPEIFHYVIYKPWKRKIKYGDYFWYYARLSPFYKNLFKLYIDNLQKFYEEESIRKNNFYSQSKNSFGENIISLKNIYIGEKKYKQFTLFGIKLKIKCNTKCDV